MDQSVEAARTNPMILRTDPFLLLMSVRISELATLLVEYAELPEFEGTGLSSVHDKGRWDSMPLHIAVHRECAAEVRVFLAAGADPNAPGEYGERPLHIAV